MNNHQEISSFVWNLCDDVLRGLFKQHEYGDRLDFYKKIMNPKVFPMILEGMYKDIRKEYVEGLENQPVVSSMEFVDLLLWEGN